MMVEASKEGWGKWSWSGAGQRNGAHGLCKTQHLVHSSFLPLGDYFHVVFHDKKQPLGERGSLRNQKHTSYRGSGTQLCQRQTEDKSHCVTLDQEPTQNICKNFKPGMAANSQIMSLRSHHGLCHQASHCCADTNPQMRANDGRTFMYRELFCTGILRIKQDCLVFVLLLRAPILKVSTHLHGCLQLLLPRGSACCKST